MVDSARSDLLAQVRDYHDAQSPGPAPFIPGQTPILSSGAVLDAADREALVAAALDLRIASGTIATKFESSFARKLKRRKAVLTKVPWPLKLFELFPVLRRIPARMVGLGVRREHIRSPDAGLRR